MESLGVASLASYDKWGSKKLKADQSITYSALRRLLQEDCGVVILLSYVLHMCLCTQLFLAISPQFVGTTCFFHTGDTVHVYWCMRDS